MFSYTYNADQPLTAEELAILDTGVRFPPQLDRCVFRLKDGYLIDIWRPRRNNNDYLIDREVQQSQNYTGILGINDQDRSVQESLRSAGASWGAAPTAVKKNSGSSDIAIIAARNRLLKAVREFQAGTDPYPAYHGDLYDIRPLDVISKRGRAIAASGEIRKAYAGSAVTLVQGSRGQGVKVGSGPIRRRGNAQRAAPVENLEPVRWLSQCRGPCRLPLHSQTR